MFLFLSILVSAQVAMEWNILFESTTKKRDPLLSPDGKDILFYVAEKGVLYFNLIEPEEPEVLESLGNYGKRSSSRFHLLDFDGETLYFSDSIEVAGQTINQFYISEFSEGQFLLPKPTSFAKLTGLKDFVLCSDLGNKRKVFVKKTGTNDENIYEAYLTPNGGVVTGSLPKILVRNGIENLTTIGDNGLIFQYRAGQSIAPELYLSIRENGEWSIPVELEFAERFPKKKDIPKYLKIEEKESIRPDGKDGYKYVFNPDGRSSYNETARFIVFSSGGKVVKTILPEEFRKRISYDYPDQDSLAQEVKPDRQLVEEKSKISDDKPRYYALLIGIEDYQFNQGNLDDLSNPITDAKNLEAALVTDYSFEAENINVLKNPNRADIINAFEEISKVLTQKDNFLVFYAGHGFWDEKLNIGYWLSSDATIDSKSNWISNSTVRDYIAGLNTKHTLLISDACFSGSIFKTREVTKSIDDYGYYRLNKLPSRKAMTSGTLNTVPDESKFMKYLLKALAANEKEYFPSKQLFHEIEIAIINNTTNIPQFGTIQNTGDEGGDFIFIKKK